jgi:hypothetical protein
MLILTYLVLIPLGSAVAARLADAPGRPGGIWHTATTLGLVLAVAGFTTHRLDLHRTGYTEGQE